MRAVRVRWLLLALLSVTPGRAFAQNEYVYLRGSICYAQRALSDWDFLAQVDGYPADPRGLSRGMPLGAEVGVRFNKRIAFGLILDSRESTAANSSFDSTLQTSTATSVDISVVSLVGNVSTWIPGVDGLYVAEQIGVGFGKVDSRVTVQDLDAKGSSSRRAWVIGASLGYQRDFARGVLAFVETGFRYQDFGKMNGPLTGAGPPGRRLLLTTAGQDIATDFSGLRAVVGVGFRFMRR